MGRSHEGPSSAVEPTAAPAREHPDAPTVPRLTPGLELLGRAQGSGYVEPPYLLRRGDGRVVEVSPLVHDVVLALDGQRDIAAVADHVTARVGKRLRPEHVAFLVDQKLRPLGVVCGPKDEPASPPSHPHRPLLALTVRTAVVSRRRLRAVTTALRPLFLPPVMVGVLAAVTVLDVSLLGSHAVGGAVRQALYDPAWLLVVAGLSVLGGGVHELGHATGARYGGAEPGSIGLGFYLMWPVFYNDLTDAYRLGRSGRLRADVGGVYFNAVYVVVLALVYLLTGFDVLLVVIVTQHVAVLHQLLPFVRLDGYYLLCDLTGVPDLFARVRPLLAGRTRSGGRQVSLPALRPGVRAAVAAWVAVTLPVLAAGLVAFVVRAPHVLGAGHGSLRLHLHDLGRAWETGDTSLGLLSAAQLAVLAVPFVGTALLAARALARLVTRLAWRRTGD